MTLTDILADLSAAQRALQQSATAFDDAMAGLTTTLAAIKAANDAQLQAINAVVAATDKALRLVQTNGQH